MTPVRHGRPTLWTLCGLFSSTLACADDDGSGSSTGVSGSGGGSSTASSTAGTGTGGSGSTTGTSGASGSTTGGSAESSSATEGGSESGGGSDTGTGSDDTGVDDPSACPSSSARVWVAHNRQKIAGDETSALAWLVRPDGSDSRTAWPEQWDPPGLAGHPRWSPDGGWFVSDHQVEPGIARLWAIAIDPVSDLPQLPRDISPPELSFVGNLDFCAIDGHMAMVAEVGLDYGIHLIDPVTGDRTSIHSFVEGSPQQLRWSPNCEQLVTDTRGGGRDIIWVVDRAGTRFEAVTPFETPEGQIQVDDASPSWTHDGEAVVAIRTQIDQPIHSQIVELRPGPAGQPWTSRVLAIPAARYSHAQASPVADVVAIVLNTPGASNRLSLHALTSGEEVAGVDFAGVIWEPRWSADGRYITYYAADADHFDLHVFDVATSTSTRLDPAPTHQSDPAWRPCPTTLR